jgi:LPS-assembly protein
MPFEQTLEPQAYYTYIPYRNQASIPVFDTTVNTLTYDQLFNYNRFSGIDRIGDANQIGLGVSSRFIDQESGLEKARVGVGDIIYFANRMVTLCNSSEDCSDNPDNHANYQRLSPISGMASYSVNPLWSVGANAIWNPVSKQTDNNSMNLHYQSDERHIVNLGYSFARNGDIYSGISTNTSENNLKLTDLSMVWPLTMSVSALGRWSEDWHINRLQNLLGGLQYDTCCWAMRLVGGREFVRLNPNSSTPQYNNEVFIQFALKGLGNIGSGNPSGILSNIYGYRTDFGQDS